MAGQGPAGKVHHTRARNDKQFAALQVTGELYGDALPDDVLPWAEGGESREAWHPQTLRWWRSIRTFPMLKDEPDLGWQFLIDTALMHHTMWTKGRWEFAAELRLRMAKYGATPEDRMRLKITVEKPDGELEDEPGLLASTGEGTVTSISDRRARLLAPPADVPADA